MPYRLLQIILFSLVAIGSARAEAPQIDLYTLHNRAAALELAGDPHWSALLHYHSSLFYSDGKSTVDDERFFLSPVGKTNLNQELEAAIDAFFGTFEDNNLHPQCRFPARYIWLKQKLEIDESNLQNAKCKEFNTWKESLNAKGISLIFPASYLNNPASAFGHTLLRFDTGATAKQDALLSYTASYAASTKGENAILYALKGIFGGYTGQFSVLPYHKKVRQYNDIEHRNIWEYRLNFTAEEVDFAVRHLWELKDAVFDYYYFDDNCAFLVLSYLDAIRPSLESSKNLWPWVIPIDTIHALTDESDIISETVFRPSAATTLKYQLENASPKVQQLAFQASTNIDDISSLTSSDLSKQEKGQALELAYERMRYYELSGAEPQVDEKQRALALLKHRSALGISQILPPLPQPKVSPEQGHPTLRLSLGLGHFGDRSFYELEARPAYHDLLDPSGGFVRGSEIRFLELAARQHENGSLQLQRFLPLQIRSISPRSLFLHPISWDLSLGLERKALNESKRRIVNFFNLSVGPAWEPIDSLLLYTQLGPKLELSQSIRNNHALGAAIKAGGLLEATENLALLLESEATRFGIGDSHSEFVLSAGSRVTLTRQMALRLSVSKNQTYRQRSSEIVLSINYFR